MRLIACWMLIPLFTAISGCSLLDHVSAEEESPASTNSPDPIAQLAFALESTCVALKDGRLFCWGKNLTEQFGGAIPPEGSPTPVQVAPGSNVTGVALSANAGNGAGCVVTTDGNVKCAGDDQYAQLANGPTVVNSGSFESITGSNGQLRSVYGGPFRFCAVDQGGQLLCWGESGYGQSGSNGGQTVTPKALVPSGVIRVAVGAVFSCVAVDGSAPVLCFGNNDQGSLGNGVAQPDVAPEVGAYAPVSVGLEALGFVSPARSLSAGNSHACAVDADRALYCWGKNDAGQTGTGTDNVRHFRWLADGTLESFDGNVAEVVCVDDTTCVLLMDGSIQCFGAGAIGLLGDGSTAARDAPGLVALPAMNHLVGGATALCAHAGKELYCWGENDAGQLGNGEKTAVQATPVAVQLP